ncbi:1731_t:CDS:2, partial [Paraglomus occultum]
QHGPTSELIGSYMSSMCKSLPNVNFVMPKLSADQNNFFDRLLMAKDLQDVCACTSEERILKKLVDRMYYDDSVSCSNKDQMSEYEHIMQNIVPFIDATFSGVPHYRVHYFESALHATVIHHNKVSGGLPKCTCAKGWMDTYTLKLGWELHDIWVLAQDMLKEVIVNASSLVVWGFTVVAYTICIYYYALAAAGGLFHLMLVCEAPLPSSNMDMCNVKIAYCAMLGFLQKLDATKMKLVNLNKERTAILCSGVKRKDPPSLFCLPPVMLTPQKNSSKKKKVEVDKVEEVTVNAWHFSKCYM